MRILLLLVVIVIASCSESPRRQLSESERVADMHWMFTKFDHNYAPTQYKEKLFKFDYKELKEKYLESAKQDQTNFEFFRLMHKFIAEFKDAHTSGNITMSSLPGRSKISYLGFNGVRKGKNLLVTKLLPTITDIDSFPIKVGDIITHLDGMTLKSAINTIVLPYRNLGNKQSNYTGLMSALFTRALDKMPSSPKMDALINLKRAGKKMVVTLPWITKDRAIFNKEQKEAIAKATGGDLNKLEEKEGLLPFVASKYISHNKLKNLFLKDQTSDELLKDIRNYINNSDYKNSFEYSANTSWDLIALYEKALSKDANEDKRMNEERAFSMEKFVYEKAKTYPSAILFVKDSANEMIKVGYIRIDTFSPSSDTPTAVKEFKETLKFFKNMDVKHLILDLLDNGGGSLELGTKLAYALSAKEIELPTLQFKLNDTWLDDFERTSLTANSDAKKEIARRVLMKLEDEKIKGKTVLSSKFKMSELFPFSFSVNTSLKEGFNTIVMANEGCASMCDIFTGMLKDNKMAKVFGTKTMGAGGNVTTHTQAPNSGLVLRQTESLIVRSTGKYIENDGINPDIEYPTYNDISTKYKETLDKAIKELLK